MGHKLAIDFGTTNSVIAQWNGDDVPATILAAEGLSSSDIAGLPPVVPSLIYIQQGEKRRPSVGRPCAIKGWMQCATTGFSATSSAV
ncbi:hypothetical protein HC928_17730 [bacterium]|nr:hypothetical protein [bacterium]